ncbi:MAG: NADH-quinone oxidoreductase subunit N [Polyangiaceae bacterium]|nr:NADH-quinone oxidoreductase subunit N [Polyangiaceae bacterium]
MKPLDNIQSLGYFAAEFALVGAMVLVIVWDLFVKNHRTKVLGALALTLAALGVSASMAGLGLAAGTSETLFGGLLAYDRFSNLFRILFAFVTAVALLFALPSSLARPKREGRNAAEMHMLMLAVTLGMNLMAASRSLLMIYVSLELVSVLSFVLAGFKLGDKKSSEGALKYVIYGGVASGVMLYGMSWVYGLTSSLDLGEIAVAVHKLTVAQGKVPEPLFLGVICMLAGMGYKVSAAPFHMWTPDVYEGAPTPVTAFLSVGPKAAGFALLLRFFSDALGADRAGWLLGSDVQAPWTIVAGCLAMATMTVGNLSALNQDNVKRMLAYSSIAHAGYMLLGFAVFDGPGTTAIGFYVFAYCFMNLGAFLVVMAVAEANGGNETLAAFRGLGKRAPVLALAMAIFLVSLAGVPPMAGFVGKFYLFSALVGVGDTWSWVLAVVGVLNSLVSLFFYARVARAMYLTEPESTEPVKVSRVHGVATFALVLPTIALGVYWAPVYDFVQGSLAMVHSR